GGSEMTGRAMLLVSLITCLVYSVPGQNRGTAGATVNGKKVSVEYGRPSIGGRDFEKDIMTMASVGTVWRLGMDQPTSLTSAGDLVGRGQPRQASPSSLLA